MDMSAFLLYFFQEIALFWVVLLISKVIFEESVVVDKKSIIFLFLIATLEAVSEALAIGDVSHRAIYNRVTDFFAILSLFVLVRGEKKRILHRVRAMIDTFLCYIMSISFYCCLVYVMLHPSVAGDFEFMDTKTFTAMVSVVSAVVFCYLYFALFRKGICLNFGWKERLLLILFSCFVCITAGELENFLNTKKQEHTRQNMDIYL